MLFSLIGTKLYIYLQLYPIHLVLDQLRGPTNVNVKQVFSASYV